MSQYLAEKVPVLIASTLKPIQDIRAFGKLAFSLGETNKYRLFIIGFSAKRPISPPGFRFFSSMSHFDSRMDRLLAQLRFMTRLIQIRPKILICCTYELLPIAAFFKPLMKYKIVYDVQENYSLNLSLNPELSLSTKQKTAKLIGRAESVQGIDLYLFAEKCYSREMPEKQPFLILENKFKGEIRKKLPVCFQGKRSIRFCITGTITPAFGAWDAMVWFREILKTFPNSELIIMGHCPLNSFRKELQKAALEISNLILHLDQNPVHHDAILKVVETSDFSLLPYQNHDAIRDKMPTKLFECAALGIPVLISPNPIWDKFLSDFDGGFSVDFLNPSKAVDSLNVALDKTFFTSAPPETIQWKTESARFQQAIQNLLS